MKEAAAATQKLLAGAQLGFSGRVKMRPDTKSPPPLPEKWDEAKQPALIIKLTLASAADGSVLAKFRQGMAALTGIAMDEGYQFHTSFGYQLRPMSGARYENFRRDYFEWLDFLGGFEIAFSSPQLCWFEDMFYFKPLLALDK